MTWEPMNHGDYDQLHGRDVYGANNQKIGSVDQVLHPANETRNTRDHFLLVKGGLLGNNEYYVPQDAVELVGEDRVVLMTTKDELESRGWNKLPTGYRQMS